MFRVPLHVPVQERGDRVELHRPAALAKVIGLRFAADVHRVVHQGVVPAPAVEPRQAHHHDQEPLSGRDRPHRKRRVEQELGELPPVCLAALARTGLLIYVARPHAAPRVAQVGPEQRVELIVQRRYQGADVDHLNGLPQHLLGGLGARMHPLALAAAVQSVAMVILVAHAVGREIAGPVDQPEDPPEQTVEPAGAEHGAVREFVRLRGKGEQAAVEVERRRQQQPLAVAVAPVAGGAGRGQNRQHAEGVPDALQIAAPHEARQQPPVDRRPLPVDPDRSVGVGTHATLHYSSTPGC